MTHPVSSRGPLPAAARPYSTIGPFDAASLPKGLRAEHSLKPGTWGLLELTQGALRFVWNDEQGGADEIIAPAQFIVPPETLHHVEGAGPFDLTITFYRE